jgi:hypothetical protein
LTGVGYEVHPKSRWIGWKKMITAANSYRVRKTRRGKKQFESGDHLLAQAPRDGCRTGGGGEVGQWLPDFQTSDFRKHGAVTRYFVLWLFGVPFGVIVLLWALAIY